MQKVTRAGSNLASAQWTATHEAEKVFQQTKEIVVSAMLWCGAAFFHANTLRDMLKLLRRWKTTGCAMNTTG